MKLDIEKFNAQYDLLKCKYSAIRTTDFGYDNEHISIGATLKDLAKKWLAFQIERMRRNL